MMIWFSLIISVLLVSWTSGLPTSDEKPIVCNKKGRLMNPEDCGSFYECMEDDNARSLLSFEKFCPKGNSFNSSYERCGKTLNVQGCNARRGKHLSSNPKYDYFCKKSNVSFACIDCQTQITCTEGHAYVTKCLNKMRCVVNSPDFEGGVCHTHFDDQCRCTSPNSYHRDPFSNSTYFLCDAENAVPIYHNCQQGMYFDEITKTCVNNDGSPACTASGLLTFPENCAKYYMCTSAVEGWDKKILSCPDKQLFNQETEKCEDPCNWERKEFKCATQGRFQNPNDCQIFTECVVGKKGDLLAMVRRCPPGFHFNEKNKKCVVRALSSCNPFKEGPLQQCKKEFLALCKNKTEIISETISETVPLEENDGMEPKSDIITEEAGKMSEQNLAKGNPTNGTLVGKISVKETPMEKKPKAEKKTEGTSVEKTLVKETPMEKKPKAEKKTEGISVEETLVKETPMEKKLKAEKKTEGISVVETLVKE